MAKTNLVKMEVYFDLDTQSFIALDPETGEFRDFSVSKKSTTTKKKSVVSDDATPKLILETSKYTLTQAAANLLGVKPDDRIDIKYQKIGNILVPVIGSNTAFGTKAGNKLTKSLNNHLFYYRNQEGHQDRHQYPSHVRIYHLFLQLYFLLVLVTVYLLQG